jgi:transposase
MIQITPHMRILVAVEPVDFRAGIDGLAAVCRKRLQADPMTGTLFVFGNRRRTAIRVLVYDGQGFWLCTKRLSASKFSFWPAAHTPTRTLQACELQTLLMGGDPQRVNPAPNWRQLPGGAYAITASGSATSATPAS